MGIPAFSSELEGTKEPTGALNASGKYKDYDVGALEALSQEQQPSPQGAASQGAVGDPAPAGKAPKAALDGEAPKDMLAYYEEAGDDSREHMVKAQEEAYAPHGLSLEGAAMNAIKQGGPQAMARAAKFGVDLTKFADVLNPQGKDAAVGQAFGNVPTEEQSASGEAFKSQEQATSDMKAGLQGNRDKAAEAKKQQRQAIAAFLMEAGLRTLASARDDVGGAVAEGALGTMANRRDRGRQDAADKMDAADRDRQQKRQDESDEMRRQEEARQKEAYEYDKSQRGVKEEAARLKGLEMVVDSDGKIRYYKPKEGVQTDEDGVPIDTMTEAEKRAYSRKGIDTTAYNNAVRSHMKALYKMADEGGYYGDDEVILSIVNEKDSKEKDRKIRELAQQRASIEQEEDVTDYDSLDW